jgi:peroxiredoxin Q/BCP
VDLGERFQDTHLVRGASAAAGQDEACPRHILAARIRFPHDPSNFPENNMLALRRTLVTALIAVTASVCAQTPVASPAEGTAAPALKLQDQTGKWQTLDQYKGKWVVLYFYPKDFTGGCTTQACELRDNIFAFRKADAVILGVSVDDVASHEAFAKEHSLPFDILADPTKEVSGKYGVLFSAGTTQLASRQTFLIGPDGKIVKHWAKVDPKGHSDMVLAEIKAHSVDKAPAKAG